ncbi:MAG: hypothetical protein KGI27_04765 [Thaumarchaeota archaeon]|nr:hypothetical protein [Nitrososphaerota archaeon]
MGSVHILIYKITGKQLFFNVPESVCEECDLTVNIAKKVLSEMGNKKITLEVKPWMNKALSSLFKGGWHPPVLLINGKVFSQGIVPDEQKLRESVLEELKK